LSYCANPTTVASSSPVRAQSDLGRSWATHAFRFDRNFLPLLPRFAMRQQQY
jgi:hypothetical protein